ncbi:LysE family translocator [Pectobacterium aroidearum]|uniref:LysE family translocator n=1 Tax=Pectobacterium aroidearum TaxID=1201031 RepID=UPI002114FFB0|nr:LysE family translocator [Pectobacterium aroidearum]UUE59172.1 LysE family translocator [Pectobacterium aroidearum]UUE71999.1 LysE family translocator [Pectobacterium aroidearum]UUE76398.1 LysE family translocator [Pectobacterium aroidearum]UUE80624.1 LysE family translocator [Pectobacterium aroidearum]
MFINATFINTPFINTLFSADSLFPAHFPALALAHFVALLSPGPDFFLLTAYAIRYRLRGSAGICLGIALGNGMYILLAAIGWAGIQHSPTLFSLIELAGAAYLIWVGYQLVKSRSVLSLQAEQQSNRCPTLRKQVLLGLGSALLNPKNMLFYISLMTSILGQNVTPTQQFVSGSWMFSVVLMWDLLIAALIARPLIQQHLTRWLNPIERGAGVILLFFGVLLLFR